MEPALLRLPPTSRRAFLAGVCASATPALLARHLGGPEDMAAAARLFGLEFGKAELEQAGGRLEELRRAYGELRAAEVALELPPCARFDPLPPGEPPPAPGPGFDWQPAAPEPPRDDTELAFADVSVLASWLRQGAVTSRRLVELCLQRLERFDPVLRCVITPLREEALATADERDRELGARRPRGPLHGIPFGAKDLFAWPGAPTTFGAGPYREHVWPVRATVLDRLHAAGAVLVAKLSLGALAMGDLWFGGRTRNPWNPEQGSSGSSAGSASAVAAGLVPFALGTETLGSIVSPCRRCGVGGLRPTFGAVSRHGAMPLSWTMDKVGPIARSATDLALVFDAIRGADGRDPAARDAAFPFAPARGLEGLRIGVLAPGRRERRNADQERFVAWLREQGAAPATVRLPEAPYRAMLVMLHAEAATAFDDLLRQGRLGELPGQDDGDWPNQFRCARTIPAVEYLRASRLRSGLQRSMAAALDGVDVLVAPTHGGPTLTATNLTGHPTLVLPVGAEDGTGQPTVLALVGRLHGEAALLRVAAAWQAGTDWHRRRPELTG